MKIYKINYFVFINFILIISFYLFSCKQNATSDVPEPTPTATSVPIIIDNFEDGDFNNELYSYCNGNQWGNFLTNEDEASIVWSGIITAGGGKQGSYCRGISGTVKTNDSAGIGHFTYSRTVCGSIGIDVSEKTKLKLDIALYGSSGNPEITYYLNFKFSRENPCCLYVFYNGVINANTGWQTVTIPLSSFTGSTNEVFSDLQYMEFGIKAISNNLEQIANLLFFIDNIRFE